MRRQRVQFRVSKKVKNLWSFGLLLLMSKSYQAMKAWRFVKVVIVWRLVRERLVRMIWILKFSTRHLLVGLFHLSLFLVLDQKLAYLLEKTVGVD